MQLKSSWFLLALTLCLLGCSNATLIINGGAFANMTLQSGQYYWKGDDWSLNFEPITAQLADSSMEDLNGKIVFQEFIGNRDWLARIIQLQSAGAIAILYGTDSLVSGQYGCALTAAEPTGQITIPIAEINQGEFAEIRQAVLNGTIVEATLTSEGNPWNLLGGVAVIVVFRAIYTAVSVGLIGYATYKLVFFVRYQRSQFNVPQVVLALEIIANLLRIVYFAVDPFACFGNYGIATNFLTTISFPFEVATFVLITFYWYVSNFGSCGIFGFGFDILMWIQSLITAEKRVDLFEAVTNASITIYPFVERFRPFFFAFTIIFIAVIILVSVLGYFLAFSITTPVIIIYVIVSLAFLIFYIVTVVKIVKKISKSNNLRQKKTKALTEVNKKIILNGVIRVVSLIPVIIYVSPEIATEPLPQLVGSVFIYATIMLDSWARIYLFKEPKRSKSTTGGSNSKKSEQSGFTGSTAKAEMGESQAPDAQV